MKPTLPDGITPKGWDAGSIARSRAGMKDCPTCGRALAQSAVSCPQCGHALRLTDANLLARILIWVILLAIGTGIALKIAEAVASRR